MHKGTYAQGPGRSRRPAVHIIDDDTSVRTALERLLVSAGIRAATYPGAREFLDAGGVRDGDCVVTDVRMQGMTGLDLQREVQKTGRRLAFLYVTAYDTPQARQEAREAGAAAFFRKPVDDQALLDAIAWACSLAQEGRGDAARTPGLASPDAPAPVGPLPVDTGAPQKRA